MDEVKKKELASKHDEELNAPFTTFECNDKVYHGVGLIQIWVRGYGVPDTWYDPPKFTEEFKQWLKDHDSEVTEWFVGPPHIVFPNQKIAQAFKEEWHDKARERYPYEAREEYERTVAPRNREILGKYKPK